jgi:hypothetical protein
MGVTVTDIPGPAGAITGVASVCEGGTSYVYSVGTISNTHSYVWSVPAGATITAGQYSNSITVDYAMGATSGSVTVYGNSTCGNGTTSPAYLVTVNQLPETPGAIVGQGSVCKGTEGVEYTVPVINGATGYVWVVPTGATIVSGANTNLITVNFSMSAISGDVTVYGTNACGNGSVSEAMALTLKDIPLTPVITDAGMILSSDVPTGNQWYHDGTMIPGATDQTYTVTQSGYYWDIVTLNGCSSMASNQIYFPEVGINQNPAPQISVFPVPNDGQFKLSIISAKEVSYNLSVVNDLGVVIYLQKDVIVSGTLNTVIDLRPVPPGVYSLIISNADTRVARKIVINK